ncbi:PBECR2 nuclease fold domain-containing protein, partial [Helicobacter heilmannii]|uniref:PBECR2 nuclease fold domain-containing protein n=1 Tax=Helicobacter heilmannii TaxID=35817 RepID=UPI0032D9B042
AITARFDNSTKRLIKAWTEELEQGVEQIGSKERPYELITDKEAFIKDLDLSVNATLIPKEIDIEGFLKSLEEVKNHKNFIEHLQDKGNATERLAYLNLVEPTLKSPDIELFFKDPEKKEYIKAFVKEDGENLIYLLVTKDADTLLITGIPDIHQRYLRSQIRDADIIHSFIRPNGTDPKGSSRPHLDSTTPSLKSDLSAQEIKDAISKWDLAHPKET